MESGKVMDICILVNTCPNDNSDRIIKFGLSYNSDNVSNKGHRDN